PCQELERQLKNQPVLNSDETGWRNNGEKRYLWALVARNFVFYAVAKTRSSAVLIHLLGAVFAGILCSDRFSAYFKYHKGLAQLCWAHLKRNILGIQDFAKTTDAQRFCRDALALYARLFRLWRKFQGSLIDRNQLILRSIPLQKRWFALAEQYLDSDDKEVRNMATALFQHCGRLFTFIEHPGVEPTNNCMEQALRIAVQLRKIIFDIPVTGMLRFVNLPKHFPELRHLGVGADGHAQHIVERRERAAGSHTQARHGGDELARVAAHVDHHEVGVRLDELDVPLAQPR